MKNRTLIALLFFVSFGVVSLYAQPADLGYDPPQGWEYVRNLDSIDFKLYAHNDSLFAIFDPLLRSTNTYERSTDGGKTWSEVFSSNYPKSIQGTTILYNIGNESNHVLLLSTDMGVTWKSRGNLPVVSTHPPYVWSFSYDFIIDIHKPQTNWFVKYNRNGQFERLYFTSDGGYTWEWIQTPYPSNVAIANYVFNDVQFDFRDSGAWYFTVTGIYDPSFGITPDTVKEYYLSRDQGKTFDPVPIIGDVIGVKEKGEQWFWTDRNRWYEDPYYVSYKTIDSNKNEKTTELLKQILPYKLPLDTAKGYGYLINVNSIFFSPDPLQSLVRIRESSFENNSRDTLYFDTSWVYYTKDLKNFLPLWVRPRRGLALNLFTDFGSGIVYLQSIDTPAVHFLKSGSVYRQSLWKRKVFTMDQSSVRSSDRGEKDMYADIYWDAERRNAELILVQGSSKYTRIALYDVLGRKVKELYNGMLSSGKHRFPIIQGETGMLFLHIDQSDYSKTLKVLFQR